MVKEKNEMKSEILITKKEIIKWEKPTIKTVTSDELKKIIVISACSEYDPVAGCLRAFAR